MSVSGEPITIYIREASLTQCNILCSEDKSLNASLSSAKALMLLEEP